MLAAPQGTLVDTPKAGLSTPMTQTLLGWLCFSADLFPPCGLLVNTGKTSSEPDPAGARVRYGRSPLDLGRTLGSGRRRPAPSPTATSPTTWRSTPRRGAFITPGHPISNRGQKSAGASASGKTGRDESATFPSRRPAGDMPDARANMSPWSRAHQTPTGRPASGGRGLRGVAPASDARQRAGRSTQPSPTGPCT